MNLRKIFSLVALLLVGYHIGIPGEAFADFRRQKNTASRVEVKFYNSSTGQLISGATGMACKCATWSDGSNPSNLTTACGTSAPTESGTSGVYYLPLTAGETNADYVTVLCTSTSTNAIPFVLNIDTRHGTVLTDSAGALEDLGTTAGNDIQTAINAKLDAAIPGSPTADSIYDRIKKLTDPTGTFRSGSTTTSLVLASGETSNDITGAIIYIETGAAAKDFCAVSAYNTSTKTATCGPALTNAPASGDAYTLLADAPSNIDAAQVASAVWSAARSSYTGSGTFGQGVASVQGNVTGSVNSVTMAATCGTVQDKTGYSISGTKTTLDALNDVSSSTVNTQVTNALNNYDAPTKAEMDAAFTDIKGPGWVNPTDTLHSIKNGCGSGGGGGGSCDNEAIAAAVWDELLTNHQTSGSASRLIQQAINTTLSCEARKEQ